MANRYREWKLYLTLVLTLLQLCVMSWLIHHSWKYYKLRKAHGYVNRKSHLALVVIVCGHLYFLSRIMAYWINLFLVPFSDSPHPGLVSSLGVRICMALVFGFSTTMGIVGGTAAALTRTWLIFFEASFAIYHGDQQWVSLVNTLPDFTPDSIREQLVMEEESKKRRHTKSNKSRTFANFPKALKAKSLSFKTISPEARRVNSSRKWAAFTSSKNVLGSPGGSRSVGVTSPHNAGEEIEKRETIDLDIDHNNPMKPDHNPEYSLSSASGTHLSQLSGAYRSTGEDSTNQSMDEDSQNSRLPMDSPPKPRLNWFATHKHSFGNEKFVVSVVALCAFPFVVVPPIQFYFLTTAAQWAGMVMFLWVFLVCFSFAYLSHKYPNRHLFNDAIHVHSELRLLAIYVSSGVVIYLVIHVVWFSVFVVPGHFSFLFRQFWETWIAGWTALIIWIHSGWVIGAFAEQERLMRERSLRKQRMLETGQAQAAAAAKAARQIGSDSQLGRTQTDMSTIDESKSTSGTRSFFRRGSRNGGMSVTNPKSGVGSGSFSGPSNPNPNHGISPRFGGLGSVVSRTLRTASMSVKERKMELSDMSLENVLSDRAAFRCFVRYLFSEFCHENLLAVFEMIEFREMIKRQMAEAERLKKEQEFGATLSSAAIDLTSAMNSSKESLNNNLNQTSSMEKRSRFSYHLSLAGTSKDNIGGAASSQSTGTPPAGTVANHSSVATATAATATTGDVSPAPNLDGSMIPSPKGFDVIRDVSSSVITTEVKMVKSEMNISSSVSGIVNHLPLTPTDGAGNASATEDATVVSPTQKGSKGPVKGGPSSSSQELRKEISVVDDDPYASLKFAVRKKVRSAIVKHRRLSNEDKFLLLFGKYISYSGEMCINVSAYSRRSVHNQATKVAMRECKVEMTVFDPCLKELVRRLVDSLERWKSTEEIVRGSFNSTPR